ncbi:uroporphyrinogen-III C-methyltransferase [Acidovorax sp. D2M1]|uniref:Uroporphyrinogen-III C-methyltransferase n=1 Tax=Acidovorax benzenivorans TaxID=2987520 RepID=A0ABT5RYS4_9BURK|nr:uroporphyrinogen-III C-methyltransferase [Acidovorax benzenivorans]MDD2178830.1 uroporphyrinogen-III C-methyltransferase [Acidovorax benzenivorans]
MSSAPPDDLPSTPPAAPVAAAVGAPAVSPAPSPATPAAATSAGRSGAMTLLLGTVAVAALVSSGLLWQKLSAIQEQLARQSADSGALAIEARTMARQAEEQVRDTAARLSVAEARVSEVALQRSQLEELMQSLSRSRDENLVVDIESAIRLAQQQAQLTGSLEPLVAALKSANQRIERSAQPRLAPVQRAIGRDLDRLTRATVTDTAGLLARLDELVRQVDDLPVLNAVAQAAATKRLSAGPGAQTGDKSVGQGDLAWWQTALQRSWEVVRDEARSLVRVSRIDQPEAILLAPEQTFFLRENLKFKLLNARLGVLARQFESARADLAAATAALNKYFDPASRRTQNVASTLQQAQASMKAAELPRLDETLSALATAAAGR